MKKLFLIPLVTTFAFSYEACGTNETEALNALSKSIYVSVSNRFDKKEELNEGVFNSFNKNLKNESSQSSNVVLKNVKYSEKNGEVCAYVSKQDVEKSAKESLNFLLSFKLSNLPQNFQDKQKKIAELITKINFVKAVSNPTQSQLLKLNRLEKSLKDLTHNGEIIFNLNTSNASIKISGNSRIYSPSTPILLPAGEYSYTITAPNKCPITGTFIVKEKQTFTINKDLGNYPSITLTSNQPSTRAELDGERVTLNSPKIVKKCKGEIIWSMKFENQSEKGSLDLEPNLVKTINQDFTPRIELERIKKMVGSYTASKNEVTISYGYAIADEDHKEWDGEKRIEIRKFNRMGNLKLGFGILAGTKTEWTAKDMNELEVAISARWEIPELLDTTLHIYKIPVIPYFGVEGGWDLYKFIDNFSDYDASYIKSIFRGTIGTTFLFNKQFGINVEYSKGFLEKRDSIFGAGIVLDF